MTQLLILLLGIGFLFVAFRIIVRVVSRESPAKRGLRFSVGLFAFGLGVLTLTTAMGQRIDFWSWVLGAVIMFLGALYIGTIIGFYAFLARLVVDQSAELFRVAGTERKGKLRWRDVGPRFLLMFGLGIVWMALSAIRGIIELIVHGPRTWSGEEVISVVWGIFCAVALGIFIIGTIVQLVMRR